MLSRAYYPRISQQRRVQLVTPPVCAPISMRDWQTTLKLQVNVSGPDVERRIKSATRLVEKYIRKSLVAQVWDMFLDDECWGSWPGGIEYYRDRSLLDGVSPLELRKPPLLFVNGVYVTDGQGVETTVDPSTYWVSPDNMPGRIALREQAFWPSHRGFSGFRVRFTSGFVYPFTTTGGVLTTFPAHGLQPGQGVRLQTGEADTLPDGLEEDTDYTVTNVTPNTLQLLDETAQLVTPGDSSGYNFVGTSELPETIRRAIVLTSAIELGTDAPAKIGGEGRYAPVTLPVTAADLLEGEVFYSI